MLHRDNSYICLSLSDNYSTYISLKETTKHTQTCTHIRNLSYQIIPCVHIKSYTILSNCFSYSSYSGAVIGMHYFCS